MTTLIKLERQVLETADPDDLPSQAELDQLMSELADKEELAVTSVEELATIAQLEYLRGRRPSTCQETSTNTGTGNVKEDGVAVKGEVFDRWLAEAGSGFKALQWRQSKMALNLGHAGELSLVQRSNGSLVFVHWDDPDRKAGRVSDSSSGFGARACVARKPNTMLPT